MNTWRDSGFVPWYSVPGPRDSEHELEHRRTQGALLCFVGDRALAQAAQKLLSLFLGDLQQLPGPLALGGPPRVKIRLDGSRGAFQSQPVYDSVNLLPRYDTEESNSVERGVI